MINFTTKIMNAKSAFNRILVEARLLRSVGNVLAAVHKVMGQNPGSA